MLTMSEGHQSKESEGKTHMLSYLFAENKDFHRMTLTNFYAIEQFIFFSAQR